MIRKYGCWLIAVGVLAADRITKVLSDRIPPEGVPLIPGVIGLRYTRNTGAAFSMLPPLMMTGLMMMLGGAAGNMIDRFATGYVPDMIEFLFVDFAIFNVADTFLCIGCALTALSLLRSESKSTK